MKGQCINCAHRIAYDHPQLVNTQIHECHRNPPTAVMVNTQQGPAFIAAYPPIGDPNAPAAGCGEFEPAPSPIQQ